MSKDFFHDSIVRGGSAASASLNEKKERAPPTAAARAYGAQLIGSTRDACVLRYLAPIFEA